jgi:hypothetical protein
MLLKHLEFDAEYGNSKQLLNSRERKAIEQNAFQIVKFFSSAPQIDYYLRAISIRDRSKDVDNVDGDGSVTDGNRQEKDDSRGDTLLAILLSIASQIGRMRNTLAQLWFEQLTLNEKLFGMLVVLLRGMPCSYVQGIYNATVKRLRAENLPLYDGRTQGILDLQSRLQVEIKVDHAGYEFGNLAFSTELEGQIKNYRNLLDCVISVVFDVTNYPDHEVCSILGRVVARLSGDDWNSLRFMLDNWIVKITNELEPKRQIEFLRIPAYALGELYFQGANSTPTDNSIRDLIVDTLSQWLDRFHWDQNQKVPKYDLSYAFVVMMSIAECFVGLAKSSPGGVASESKDYTKLLRLLNRTVRWNFPWVFFPDLKKDASAVVANIHLPFSDAFQYAIKLMGELLPKQFVDLVKDCSSPKKEDLDSDQVVAEDENQSMEKPAANWLNLGEEFNHVILGGIIRKMALELWIVNDKLRVFDNPSFQWLLDLAAAMYSTETIEYDMDSLAIDVDAIGVDAIQQTTEEDYRQAVRCTVQWMNQCDAPRSRERCERWFSEVIQQCSFPQRRKLAKHLKQHHLAVSSNTRDLCDSLLTRMQVLDGQPVDPSDETFGLLLVHGHASELNRLKSFSKNVQYQIGYACPLKTGFLGDLKLTEMSNGENQKSAFEGVQSRPAIIMPLLEKINWVHVQYVAVLCAAGRGTDSTKLPIADIDDLIERGEMRREKIFVVSNRAAKNQPGSPEKSENKAVSFFSIPFERSISYQDGSSRVEISVPALRKIEYEVSKRVRADLLGRSVERFVSDLRLTVTGDHGEDVKAVTQQLSDVVSKIQGTKDFMGGTGLYRRFSGLLQLLRILDIETCCQQIQEWLADSNDSISLELGKGAVLFVIRAAKWSDYQELKSILPILRLWRCLWRKIDACEQEARELISLALWIPGRALVTDMDSKAEFDSELDEMLATLPRAWRPGLLGLVEAFDKSEKAHLANMKAKANNSDLAVKAISDQEFETLRKKCEQRIDLAKGIRSDLLLGRRRIFSVEADQQYLPILFDTSSQNSGPRLELCIAYYDLLRKQLKSREITPIIFRIGMLEPVCVGGACVKEILSHPDLSPRVNIALPILDLFQEEQLQSVVIFGRKLPYDITELSTGKAASCFFVADQPQSRLVGPISCIGNVYSSYNNPKERAKFLIEQTVLQSN